MERRTLSAKQFNLIARRAFGEVLEPVGFSCADSTECTFYREAGDQCWHIVRPVRSVRLPQYDIWVFPHSPRIEPHFQEKFPDELSPPSDVWCKLHPTEGVGLSQEWFWSRTEEGFLRDFYERVKPALLTQAVPFLDAVHRFENLLPLIRSRYFRQHAGFDA